MASPAQQSIGVRADERRGSRRYPIMLDLAFKLRCGRRIERGSGKTRELSSRGVLIKTDAKLPAGAHIELSIAWPIVLNEDAGLNLYVTGQVVRTEDGLSAVRFIRYVFRVCARR